MHHDVTRRHKTKAHLTLTLPASNPGCIWIHACSVGEVGSIAPLALRLCEEGHRVHLTVVTRTGFDHAARLLGNHVGISYLPWDLPGLMRRFIGRLQPRLLLLAETEFWPGMLKSCRRLGVTVIGINTRISDRSFPRYFATRHIWRRWLSPVAGFLAQSELDAERLAAIGIPTDRIEVAGNLKYAIQPPAVDAEALRLRVDPVGKRPVVLIASTHEDEERQLLDMLPAWRAARPDILTLFVPRHPERFDHVANLIADSGFRLGRWSDADRQNQDVLLIDAMGVLADLYTIADLVIIGGSLVNIGGHNPLEAAICGRGVVTGPHVQNFRAIMGELQKEGGAIVAGDAAALRDAILRLLQHPDELATLNGHAAHFMQKQGDVLEHMLQYLRPWLENRA